MLATVQLLPVRSINLIKSNVYSAMENAEIAGLDTVGLDIDGREDFHSVARKAKLAS